MYQVMKDKFGYITSIESRLFTRIVKSKKKKMAVAFSLLIL
jgi:hypothetical protein